MHRGHHDEVAYAKNAILHAVTLALQSGDERVSDPAGRDDRVRHHMRSELTCAWATSRSPGWTRVITVPDDRIRQKSCGRSRASACRHVSVSTVAASGRDGGLPSGHWPDAAGRGEEPRDRICPDFGCPQVGIELSLHGYSSGRAIARYDPADRFAARPRRSPMRRFERFFAARTRAPTPGIPRLIAVGLCVATDLVLELELIADRDVVVAHRWDLRLQARPAVVHCALVQRRQAEAAALVEPQRVQVGGDQP